MMVTENAGIMLRTKQSISTQKKASHISNELSIDQTCKKEKMSDTETYFEMETENSYLNLH